MQSLVVSDGQMAYRATIGDTVSFDEPIDDLTVPLSLLEGTPSSAWLLVADNMDGKLDFDYNDVVVKVEHQAGDAFAYITPLAAGSTLASYLFFGKNRLSHLPGVPVSAGKAIFGQHIDIHIEERLISAADRKRSI